MRLIFKILFCIGLMLCSGCDNKAEYGEDLSSVSWLPESASKISYYRSYNYTAYEFDISEEDFFLWVKENQWDVSEITEPVTISRYNYYLIEESKDDPQFWEKVFVVVKTGYFYQWERGQSGGGIDLAYDSIINRVYYQYNPR